MLDLCLRCEKRLCGEEERILSEHLKEQSKWWLPSLRHYTNRAHVHGNRENEPFRFPASGREGVISAPSQLWIQHLAHMVCHAAHVFPLVTDWARQTLFNGRCLSEGWLCLRSAFLPLSFIHDRLTSWSRSLLGSPALFSFLVKVFPPEHLFMFAPVLVSASQST